MCLGLLATVLLNLAMGYNDAFLGNTFLIGNHFPFVSILVLVLLGLGVNGFARRFLRSAGLAGGELMLVWGMIGVGGGIGGAGMMRYFPSWMVAPAYFASDANGFGSVLLAHLPDWMLVSRDSDSHAVRWFMEGLPRGARIPWDRWAVPLAAWGAFAVLLSSFSFALVSVLIRQWSAAERLVFPLVYLPAAAAQPAPPGRILNDLFRSRLTWCGAAIPAAIWGLNGLGGYLPGLPRIPMSWGTWGLFPDRPWSEFNLEFVNVHFTAVGLAFLLTSEMSFSLWAFYVLYRLSFVWIAARGAAAAGFWSQWAWRAPTFEVTGGFLVMAGALVLTARAGLRAWLRRAVHGRDDPALDALPPRLALGLLVAGAAGMAGWMLLAGASWWAAPLAVLLFACMLLVLTRIVAEAGLMFVQCGVISYDVLAGLVPASWLDAPTLACLAMQKGVFTHDHREILMPYLANGLEGTSRYGIRPRRALAVFALALVVGLGVSAYSRITTCYKYGGLQMDVWANVISPQWFLSQAVKLRRDAPALETVRLGALGSLPVNALHAAAGSGVALGLYVLRARFAWWPLHPFGMVMCAPYTIGKFWFSIFLGWLAKTLVLRLGGAAAYRRAVAFFLGLVLGESLIAGLWSALGLLTGVPGPTILPG